MVIAFDALQQKFYLDTFELLPEEEINYLELLKNHFFRWIFWALLNIPIIGIAWKAFTTNHIVSKQRNVILLSASIILSIQISILVISFWNIYTQDILLSTQNVWENFQFFFFQKTISFLFASCLLVLLVYNKSKKLIIEAQWVKIENLSSSLQKRTVADKDAFISIKIGNTIKQIPLNEVTWIQADDYCVKIHTSEKAYSLRKSLKSLEAELKSFNFVRVHRRALLNMSFMGQIDYQAAKVKLTDKTEIPISKKGAQELRKMLKLTTI